MCCLCFFLVCLIYMCYFLLSLLERLLQWRRGTNVFTSKERLGQKDEPHSSTANPQTKNQDVKHKRRAERLLEHVSVVACLLCVYPMSDACVSICICVILWFMLYVYCMFSYCYLFWSACSNVSSHKCAYL